MRETYQSIYQRAAERKGSAAALEALLSKPKTAADISQITDDCWLEEFTCKIFQSGFYWKIVSAKWPGFLDVFWQFDINKLLMMPPEMLERKAADPRIIRNFKKVKTIPHNAQMIADVSAEFGSFGQFIADWPCHDIPGLWDYLKKYGSRLGGNTSSYALRAMGKDTFILSKDLESYCRQQRIIEGGLHTQRSLKAINSWFMELQAESQRSLQELSQMIALSVGDNYVGWSRARG